MSFESPVAPVSPASPATDPFTPAPAAPQRGRRAGRILDVALAAAAMLAVGGVAFAAGRVTAPAAAPAGFGPVGDIVRPGGSFDPGQGGFDPSQGGPRFGLGGGLTVEGTVTAVDGDSITVTTDDGQERTFVLSDATTWHESTDASADDVAVGDSVTVRVSVDGAAPGPGAGGDASDLPASDVTRTP